VTHVCALVTEAQTNKTVASKTNFITRVVSGG
jgi:hypothetical protein